jgi:hypothetical protein
MRVRIGKGNERLTNRVGKVMRARTVERGLSSTKTLEGRCVSKRIESDRPRGRRRWIWIGSPRNRRPLFGMTLSRQDRDNLWVPSLRIWYHDVFWTVRYTHVVPRQRHPKQGRLARRLNFSHVLLPQVLSLFPGIFMSDVKPIPGPLIPTPRCCFRRSSIKNDIKTLKLSIVEK